MIVILLLIHGPVNTNVLLLQFKIFLSKKLLFRNNNNPVLFHVLLLFYLKQEKKLK